MGEEREREKEKVLIKELRREEKFLILLVK
jgi:hypothetical protein